MTKELKPDNTMNSLGAIEVNRCSLITKWNRHSVFRKICHLVAALVITLGLPHGAMAGVDYPAKYMNNYHPGVYYDSAAEMEEASCTTDWILSPEQGCVAGVEAGFPIDYYNRSASVYSPNYWQPGNGQPFIFSFSQACPFGGSLIPASGFDAYHPFTPQWAGCGCPDGSSLVSGVCAVPHAPPEDGNKGNGASCPHCGDPINPGDGNKYQREEDYTPGLAQSGLSLTRFYNGNSYSAIASTTFSFGKRWTQRYDAVIQPAHLRQTNTPDLSCWRSLVDQQIFCIPNPLPSGSAVTDTIAVLRADGKRYLFSRIGQDWLADNDVNDRIAANYDANGAITGWAYVSAPDDQIERYDANGTLLSITSRSGEVQRLTYSNGTTNDTNAGRMPNDAPVCTHIQAGAILPAGRLLCVTDNWGRQLQFEYDAKGRITKAITPANEEYRYAYDGPSGGCSTPSTRNPACAADNLTSVTGPDGKSKIYYYNEAERINGGTQCDGALVVGNGFGHLLNSLTGIVDENGARYASWTYDCQGRATSSQQAGGANKVSLAYGDVDDSGTHTTVTYTGGTPENPLITTRSYQFQKVLGVFKNTTIDQPCVECGGIASRTYDMNGNATSTTDWNGNITTYTYDLTRNLETSRIEGAGTPQARTITTEWHPSYRLPTKIAAPNKLTINTYDAHGNLLSRSEQATDDATGSQGFAVQPTGTARLWSYSYNDLGQVLSTTDPDGNVTQYSYDSQGNLAQVTDAASHVTTLSHYDPNGRVGQITDPNGLVTTFTYSPRGWLTTKQAGDELTRYDYDGVGQMTQVTLPDGSALHYTYDDSHRLTAIADNAGDQIHYTLDAMGNRTQEQITDPNGTLTRQTSRVYDALNRLQQVTGGLQ